MSSELLTSLDDVESIAEDIDDVIESTDFTQRRVTMPGKYLSVARELVASDKISKDGKKYVSLAIRLIGGLQDAGGNVFNDGQYPLRSWVNSLPLQRRDFQTQQPFPGTTSSLAEYLKAAGVNPKGMRASEAAEAALGTAGTPVFVRIGRTERSSKLADGSYAKRKTYTKHWNLGTKESPIWATEIPDPNGSGVMLLATETIEGFNKVS